MAVSVCSIVVSKHCYMAVSVCSIVVSKHCYMAASAWGFNVRADVDDAIANGGP